MKWTAIFIVILLVSTTQADPRKKITKSKAPTPPYTKFIFYAPKIADCQCSTKSPYSDTKSAASEIEAKADPNIAFLPSKKLHIGGHHNLISVDIDDRTKLGLGKVGHTGTGGVVFTRKTGRSQPKIFKISRDLEN